MAVLPIRLYISSSTPSSLMGSIGAQLFWDLSRDVQSDWILVLLAGPINNIHRVVPVPPAENISLMLPPPCFIVEMVLVMVLCLVVFPPNMMHGIHTKDFRPGLIILENFVVLWVLLANSRRAAMWLVLGVVSIRPLYHTGQIELLQRWLSFW